MQELRRAVWQATRQLGWPPQDLQALATTLLQAFWHATIAALGQVTRSESECCQPSAVLQHRDNVESGESITVKGFAIRAGKGARKSGGGEAEHREEEGGLHGERY